MYIHVLPIFRILFFHSSILWRDLNIFELCNACTCTIYYSRWCFWNQQDVLFACTDKYNIQIYSEKLTRWFTYKYVIKVVLSQNIKTKERVKIQVTNNDQSPHSCSKYISENRPNTNLREGHVSLWSRYAQIKFAHFIYSLNTSSMVHKVHKQIYTYMYIQLYYM
jgi:hypothetical protein